MPKIILTTPATIVGSTDSNGELTISIRVPGTFGLDINQQVTSNLLDGYKEPFPQGRYLERAEIWCDTPLAGDRVMDFRVEDIDGVIPPELQAFFPNYPIIAKYYDDEVEETDNLKRGLFMPTNTVLKVGNIDQIPGFISSGLYLIGKFKGATNDSGRIVRCNFFWGKKING